jgi:hypothetical protein
MRWGIAVFGLVCLFFSGIKTVCGQIVMPYSGLPKYEIGAQLNGLQLNGPVVGGSFGLGGRFGFNYNQYVSLDSDLSVYNFGGDRLNTVAGFLGARVGYTSQQFGVYAKLRPGFIHFPSSPELVPPVTRPASHFVFDTGFVMVRYLENHMYLRFEVGRTFVNYGGGSYSDSVTGQVTHLGVPGGVSVGFGVGAHW